MKNDIFFVFGLCNTGDIPYVWEVAAFDDEQKAKDYVDACTVAAIEKFNDELSRGFDTGDSISVQNRFDINAQYTSYSWDEDEKRYHIDTEYRYRRVPLIHNLLQYSLTQGVKLKPSIKYDSDYKPLTMISPYTS